MEQLEYVHLDDLWENRLIYFDAPGKPHFPGSKPPIGLNTITRTGADARKPIKYQHSRGYALGSAEAANWNNKKLLLYGPPRK
jgi:hypothetical protein